MQDENPIKENYIKLLQLVDDVAFDDNLIEENINYFINYLYDKTERLDEDDYKTLFHKQLSLIQDELGVTEAQYSDKLDLYILKADIIINNIYLAITNSIINDVSASKKRAAKIDLTKATPKKQKLSRKEVAEIYKLSSAVARDKTIPKENKSYFLYYVFYICYYKITHRDVFYYDFISEIQKIIDEIERDNVLPKYDDILIPYIEKINYIIFGDSEAKYKFDPISVFGQKSDDEDFSLENEIEEENYEIYKEYFYKIYILSTKLFNDIINGTADLLSGFVILKYFYNIMKQNNRIPNLLNKVKRYIKNIQKIVGEYNPKVSNLPREYYEKYVLKVIEFGFEEFEKDIFRIVKKIKDPKKICAFLDYVLEFNMFYLRDYKKVTPYFTELYSKLSNFLYKMRRETGSDKESYRLVFRDNELLVYADRLSALIENLIERAKPS